MTANDYIALEEAYGSHNYHPLPVVLTRGKGVQVWDVSGKRYYDFLSAYSAVNQGHCHPRIVAALKEQAETLTLTSRAFYNDQLGLFEKKLHDIFGYDMALPMNTGAEAVESAIKICRKWAYEVKGIKPNQAKIMFFESNFHGRTMGAISASTEASSTGGFGPYLPGIIVAPYGDLDSAQEYITSDPTIAGIIIEPIQGEAGVILPPPGYLKALRQLCLDNNILFIADEIQSGLGRTGKMLCCDHDGIRADMVLLGKAISGGMLPVSVVLADKNIMEVIKPGQHGSTYGGNPLAARVACVALDVLIDEKLDQQAMILGQEMATQLQILKADCSWISATRGKGLLHAIELDDDKESKAGWNICVAMARQGLLAKPTRGNIIRLAPPLTISPTELQEAMDIIKQVMMLHMAIA
ncbi:MAG: ornithine--oxo-acid transaminase [Saprospiraceae bacterium]